MRYVVTIFILLSASPLYAENTLLSWKYYRTKAATGFMIVVKASTQANTTSMTVAASPLKACGSSPDDYCAYIGCFPHATLTFTVKALTPTGDSDFSEPYACPESICSCGAPPPGQGDIPVSQPAPSPLPADPPPPPYVPIVVEQPPEVPTWLDGMTLPSLPAASSDLPPLTASGDILPSLSASDEKPLPSHAPVKDALPPLR